MLQGVAVFWYIQCLIAYQFLPSEGPHVWKVWTDDDDDALKALYRASSMCTYFHSKPMHSWPGLCAAQCA